MKRYLSVSRKAVPGKQQNEKKKERKIQFQVDLNLLLPMCISKTTFPAKKKTKFDCQHKSCLCIIVYLYFKRNIWLLLDKGAYNGKVGCMCIMRVVFHRPPT